MIEFNDVDVVFGDQPELAFALLEQNISRTELLAQTGLTCAVRNANLKVSKGEICVLMGLSGSGKSSLLRTVNGLNPVTRGQVMIDTDAGPQNFHALNEAERRDVRMNKITMVFQRFALMPWLSVAENVGFGLEQKKLNKKLVHEKVMHQLELVGLQDWANKKPAELSGGMQQRVGLARAFAMETDVILMDEPFSALDPLIRHQLQDELLRLQAQLHKTVIFVSHDLDEALKLGNHIAIMKDGEIVQHDTPENIVLNPVDDYVREFVAHTNPIKVVQAHALMSELSSEQVTQPSGLQNYSGQPVESLSKKPTVVSDNTLMQDVIAIRYHTGYGVYVQNGEQIVGHISDQQIYHAMLGYL